MLEPAKANSPMRPQIKTSDPKNTFENLPENLPKRQMASRYTVGADRAYGRLLGLGKVAGTYAPYFGALVPLRLCRAKACP